MIDEDGGWDEGFEALGFERWSWIGEEERAGVPFAVTVQRRQSGRPWFEVEVTTNVGGVFDHVYADDVPTVMRLLGEWAPAMQAAAVMQIDSMFPPGATARELPNLAALLGAAARTRWSRWPTRRTMYAARSTWSGTVGEYGPGTRQSRHHRRLRHRPHAIMVRPESDGHE